MTRILRMTPPAVGAGNNPIIVNGRTYNATGAFMDMPDADAFVASANGWTVQGMVGTTAQRPSPSDTDAPTVGLRYIDTSLGKIVAWDGKAWRDPVTGLTA